MSSPFKAQRGAAPSPVPNGRRIIEPFDYHGVAINDGELKRQFDEVRSYYLRIPNDDLLKGFRLRAGLPAPGADLGGWYTSDVGHIFGQLISGYSRMYAATGDARCRDKVNALIDEWAKCIEPDGYFYYSRTPTSLHYTYDKMVGGLVDAYLYCDKTSAAQHLSRITDWAIKNLDRTRAYMDVKSEWYTLSENLYRTYLATGEQKYREFASVWEYSEYWNLFAEKRDIFERQPFHNTAGLWYHAYSHVNTLSGAGAAYLVKGDAHYLETLRNSYDYLQANQVFATGGYGPEERLLPREELPRALSVWPNSCETQCCSWAGFKLSKYLISTTGDARYGNWIEGLMLNCIGATIPMSADGQVLYHVSYNLYGYAKNNVDFGWSCCSGSRPMAVADYYDLIYFKDVDNLYVNLFTPSTVCWKHDDADVGVCQTTAFPERSNTELAIQVSRPTTFGIKIRVPGWVTGSIAATVNGEPVEATPNQLHWATFRREWHDGDRLSIAFPMKLWLKPLQSERPFPAAIMDGPVVLAARTGADNPSDKIDFEHLEEALVVSAGEPLTYHLAADPNVLFRPFYALKQGERYFVYFDPKLNNRTLPGGNVVLGKGPDISCSAGWNNDGLYFVSSTVGATATYAFEGSDIRWLGCRFDDAGRAKVQIDDQPVEIVDQYGSGRDLPFAWERSKLSPGKHSIRITVTGEKSAASKGFNVNLAGFEFIRAFPDTN